MREGVDGLSSARPHRSRSSKGLALADQLKREVLSKRLVPGHALPPEAELIKQTGLSRASVREAIRVLASEGFVEVRRGRLGGIFVAHPDTSALGEMLASHLTIEAASVGSLLEYRKVIEPRAAGLAATRATPEQLEAMANCIENNPGVGVDDKANVDFHILVAEASANALIAIMLSAVHVALHTRQSYGQVVEGDYKAANAAHRRIYQAIQAGDASAAEALTSTHMKAIESHLRSTGQLDSLVFPPEHWTARMRTS